MTQGNDYQEFVDFLRSTISQQVTPNPPKEIKPSLDLIIQKAESNRGVFTVVVTSLWKKYKDPKQDVRLHQSKMQGGYSGRTLDTKVITPGLAKFNLPCMAESGWLTRSLEQSRPYDKKYPGEIRPETLKEAFLEIHEIIHQKPSHALNSLAYLIHTTHQTFVQNKVLAGRTLEFQISRSNLLDIWDQLRNSNFPGESGASRIPVLALAAALRVSLQQNSDLSIDALESHTSPDFRSKVPGDVIIRDIRKSKVQSVYEVKHGKPVTSMEIVAAGRKVAKTEVSCYIILTDSSPLFQDQDAYSEASEFLVKNGVELLALNLNDYLKFVLTTIPDVDEVIEQFISLLNSDVAIKTKHRNKWNELLEQANKK